MALSRYATEFEEGKFEPGSRRRVLRNLLGIRSVREMAYFESLALVRTTEELIAEISVEQTFRSSDLCDWHRRWLGSIYPWAGEYRRVNLSKEGFPFAAANRVPWLMLDFERGPLRRHAPCRVADPEPLARALAVVHSELILIHPFREGNGRCARLLTTLMAIQAGLPLLDFEGVRGFERRRYIAAIHAALDRDYDPMADIFQRIIERTVQPRSAPRRYWDD